MMLLYIYTLFSLELNETACDLAIGTGYVAVILGDKYLVYTLIESERKVLLSRFGNVSFTSNFRQASDEGQAAYFDWITACFKDSRPVLKPIRKCILNTLAKHSDIVVERADFCDLLNSHTEFRLGLVKSMSEEIKYTQAQKMKGVDAGVLRRQ
jgi:hypothetical protein